MVTFVFFMRLVCEPGHTHKRTCDKKDSRSRWQIVGRRKKHGQIKQILIANFFISHLKSNNKNVTQLFFVEKICQQIILA